MMYENLKRNAVKSLHGFSSEYSKLRYIKTDDSGKVIAKNVFEKSNHGDRLNKVTADDFSLSHILEIGAYDMLKPTLINDLSSLHAADFLEHELNSAKPVKTVKSS